MLPEGTSHFRPRRAEVCQEQVAAREAQSRRAAAGRAELLAKKGASGRMQRLTELVPIPTDPCVVRESSVKVTAFWQNSEKLGKHNY